MPPEQLAILLKLQLLLKSIHNCQLGRLKNCKQAKVKVVLDPKIKVNQHEIRIEGSFGKLHSVTQNVPSTLNPKTSALAIQSVLALFERLESYVEIGN